MVHAIFRSAKIVNVFKYENRVLKIFILLEIVSDKEDYNNFQF